MKRRDFLRGTSHAALACATAAVLPQFPDVPAIGIPPEDPLSNLIYNIDPVETPFMTGKGLFFDGRDGSSMTIVDGAVTEWRPEIVTEKDLVETFRQAWNNGGEPKPTVHVYETDDLS